MSLENDNITPFRGRLTTHSDDELILLHLMGKSDKELSPELQKKLNRMNQCRDYIRMHGTVAAVIPLLMNDFQISQATAYKLYSETIHVFNVSSQPVGRDFYIDMLIGFIIENRKKAFAKGDHKTVALENKNFKETLKEFFGDNDAARYAEFQIPDITFVIHPSYVDMASREDLQKDIAELQKPKKRNNLVFDEYEILKDNDEPRGK